MSDDCFHAFFNLFYRNVDVLLVRLVILRDRDSCAGIYLSRAVISYLRVTGWRSGSAETV